MKSKQGYGRTKIELEMRHKKMVQMYKRGMPISAIAKTLGYVGNSTVYRYLESAGYLNVQLTFCQCKACGVLFVPSVRGTRDRNTNAPVYCSKKCARAVSRKKADAKRREIIESSHDEISLTELYRRDAGICYLCGGKCDYRDRIIAKDGKTVICGNLYPSIDHVVPLSRGGTHTWGNVALAHRMCNSVKSIKEQPERGIHESIVLEKSN